MQRGNGIDSIAEMLHRNIGYAEEAKTLLDLDHIRFRFQQINSLVTPRNAQDIAEIDKALENNIIPVFNNFLALGQKDIKKLLDKLDKKNDNNFLDKITDPTTPSLIKLNQAIDQLNDYLKETHDLYQLQKNKTLAQIESLTQKIKNLDDSTIDFLAIENYFTEIEKITYREDKAIISAIHEAHSLLSSKRGLLLNNFSKTLTDFEKTSLEKITSIKNLFIKNCDVLLDKNTTQALLEDLEQIQKIQFAQQISAGTGSTTAEFFTALTAKLKKITQFPKILLDLFEENNIQFYKDFFPSHCDSLKELADKFEQNKQTLENIKSLLILSKASKDEFKKLTDLQHRLEKITEEAKKLYDLKLQEEKNEENNRLEEKLKKIEAKQKKEAQEKEREQVEKQRKEAQEKERERIEKLRTVFLNAQTYSLKSEEVTDHPLLIIPADDDKDPNSPPPSFSSPNDHPNHPEAKPPILEINPQEEASFAIKYSSLITGITLWGLAIGAFIGAAIGGVAGIPAGGGFASVPSGLLGALVGGTFVGCAFSVLGFITITALCVIDHCIGKFNQNKKSGWVNQLEKKVDETLNNVIDQAPDCLTSYTSSLRDFIDLKKDDHKKEIPLLIEQTTTEIVNNHKIVTTENYLNNTTTVKTVKLE